MACTTSLNCLLLHWCLIISKCSQIQRLCVVCLFSESLRNPDLLSNLIFDCDLLLNSWLTQILPRQGQEFAITIWIQSHSLFCIIIKQPLHQTSLHHFQLSIWIINKHTQDHKTKKKGDVMLFAFQQQELRHMLLCVQANSGDRWWASRHASAVFWLHKESWLCSECHF